LRYDVIIIGGGPAGLTAAIYTSREKMSTLLLEKGVCGGLPARTDRIENYPGFPDGVSGMDLMNRFKEQVGRFGAELLEIKEVKTISPDEEKITVKTSEAEYCASTVIIASGSVPKMLDVPGEKEFFGKGVSYCATCDGPFFRGKDVAVIGCGNSGLQEGEALLRHVKSISFIEFLPQMTAEKILQERLRKREKTKFLLNHKLISINGKENVQSIIIQDRQRAEKKEIRVLGVFIYAGFLPNSEFLKGIVEMDDSGYIKTGQDMQTSVPHIYAVGDVRSKQVRQIDVACAEATIAAISIRNYLSKKSTV